MQDSRVKRGSKHVCQLNAFKLQSVEATTTARVPSQPGPEKASALSVILARQWALDWALKVIRQIGRSVSIHEISYCLLLLLCSLLLLCPCFDNCCHDPFIVRSASNCSTFLRFHSVCASVSMFTINSDNFLFLLLFLVSPSLQPRRLIHHQLTSGLPCSTSGLQPCHQIHHRRFVFILQWSVGSLAL